MSKACYVYCLTNKKVNNLNITGLDNNKIYPVTEKNIITFVHSTTPEPYTGNDEKVKEWVVQHNKVIEIIKEKSGTVIPMTFDMIIKGNKDYTAEENLKRWILANEEAINNKLDELDNKSEYNIKLIINTNKLYDSFESKNINQFEDISNRGLAYLKQKKLKREIGVKVKEKINEISQKTYNQISKVVANIVKNKCTSVNSKKDIILNISILADPDEVNRTGNILEKINQSSYINIHFTGPWSCYSFVNDLISKESLNTKTI